MSADTIVGIIEFWSVTMIFLIPKSNTNNIYFILFHIKIISILPIAKRAATLLE